MSTQPSPIEEDSKNKLTCVEGVDTRCNNIMNSNYNIVEQFVMTGNIIASADLRNGKTVFFSLSCDSMGVGTTSKNDYCEILKERRLVFENLLLTLKPTK